MSKNKISLMKKIINIYLVITMVFSSYAMYAQELPIGPCTSSTEVTNANYSRARNLQVIFRNINVIRVLQ